MSTHRLTIYGDDDETPLTVLTTDPAGDHPHLKHPGPMAESEIDLLRGRGHIGQENMEVVDVPTTPGDQSTGYLTSLLANAAGESALTGRRALHEVDRGDGFVEVLDGVIWNITLVRLPTYRIEIRDIRERERRRVLFEITNTATVVPRGVLGGYGEPYPGAPGVDWLVPPTRPLVATFTLAGSRRGYFDFAGETSGVKPLLVTPEIVLSDAQMEVLNDSTRDREVTRPGTAVRSIRRFNRIAVLWRTSPGAYTEVRHPLADTLDAVLAPLGSKNFTYQRGQAQTLLRNGQRVEVTYLKRLSLVVEDGDESLLPPEGDVEVIIRYDGPVSGTWPLHIEGMTDGEFLQACYDGDFSNESPRIRYDETAVLGFERPMRARITEPVEDMRDWLEKNWYAPRGAAPAIIGGLVTPVRYEIPPEDEELPQLDATNCRPIPGWSHGIEDAVNVVSVKYRRDAAAPYLDDPLGVVGAGDRIVTREVEAVYRYQTSIDLIGEKPLEIETELFRSIAGPEGEPVSGDVTDEIGHQLASERAVQATDRFLYGGQRITCKAMRADSDVEALRVGHWVLAAASWWPDYGTGERGANRLVQVVSRQDQDPAWTRLGLEDAGPALQPVGQPTVGTLAVTDEGEVEVPITALAEGAEARVDFMVNATEPLQSDPGWTFAGRIDETGSVFTPPQRSGATVWVRARGEAPGRRPSAWTEPQDITLAPVPRIRDVRVEFDPDGVPTVRGVPNEFAGGVRINYAVHEDPDDVPDLDTTEEFDSDPPDWLLDLEVEVGMALTVEVVPYEGYSGGVTGAAGDGFRLTVVRPAPDNVPWGTVVASYIPDAQEVEFFANGNHLSASLEWAVRVGEKPVAPGDVDNDAEGTGDESFLFETVEIDGGDPPEVWVAIWFWSGPEQTGTRGPRVLARAGVGRLVIMPIISIEVEETADYGFARAKVIDPQNRVQSAIYKTYSVSGILAPGYDHTDPPDGWTTQPAYPTFIQVPLDEKHNGIVRFAFEIRQEDGSDEWVIFPAVIFDVGMVANIHNVAISFNEDGEAVLDILADSDTVAGYITIGVDGEPADPTVFTADYTWSGRTDVIETSLVVPYGSEVVVKAAGRNVAGTVGPAGRFAKRRGDTAFFRPHIRVTAFRSGDTVTVTLTIADAGGVVTAIEHRAHPALQDGSGSLGSWTAWTGGTGSPGNEVVIRSFDLTVEPGLQGEFAWAVEYTDENGNTVRVEGSFTPGNIQAETTTMSFSASLFRRTLDSFAYALGQSTEFMSRGASTAGTSIFKAAAVLPNKVLLTYIWVQMKKDSSGASNVFHIRRYGPDGSFSANLTAPVTPAGTSGWETLEESLNEAVDEDFSYAMDFLLTSDGVANTPAFGRVRIEYDRGAYTFVY